MRPIPCRGPTGIHWLPGKLGVRCSRHTGSPRRPTRSRPAGSRSSRDRTPRPPRWRAGWGGARWSCTGCGRTRRPDRWRPPRGLACRSAPRRCPCPCPIVRDTWRGGRRSTGRGRRRRPPRTGRSEAGARGRRPVSPEGSPGNRRPPEAGDGWQTGTTGCVRSGWKVHGPAFLSVVSWLVDGCT